MNIIYPEHIKSKVLAEMITPFNFHKYIDFQKKFDLLLISRETNQVAEKLFGNK